ncbi:hypothetical protein OZX67_00090 [Bifidobacterium sp. ESL0728]|uniref:hypothetical protein n=1 Tax=Bifidobacterium sp. ESL0728 TaxID=2983220 RepID=UPI0023F87027|nr:hypothetical protein [Bifidobacterium sp. ESL0728]WEV59026.1 hypothetical protein OZX67_00090 [Bifidobacterium sp. ESL0728]
MAYSDTINDKLANLERRGRKVEARRRQAEQSLSACQDIRSHLKVQRQEFEDHQDYRRAALYRLRENAPQCRGAELFLDMMTNQIQGSPYANVADSYDETLRHIDSQVEEQELQIKDCNRQMDDIEEDKTYYKKKLKRAEEEEQEMARKRQRLESQRKGNR